MKHIQTFESFFKLNEGVKNIPFKGKVVKDFFNLVKDRPSAMFFADGKYYSTPPPIDMLDDMYGKTIHGTDDDGEDHEIELSRIEFIEFYW